MRQAILTFLWAVAVSGGDALADVPGYNADVRMPPPDAGPPLTEAERRAEEAVTSGFFDESWRLP